MSDIVDRLREFALWIAPQAPRELVVSEAADEIIRLRNQLDAARTGKALLALEAAQAEIERLIPFARLIAHAEPRKTIPMDPDDVLWDRVHPTVREAADACAAVAAYEAARKEET